MIMNEDLYIEPDLTKWDNDDKVDLLDIALKGYTWLLYPFKQLNNEKFT